MVISSKVKPKALQPGSTIGIVSPSSPIDKSKLESGLAVIKARGYNVVIGNHVLDRHPHNSYLAGRDEDRAADINEMFARDDIDGIFCAGGGYGAGRTLPLLDWELIHSHPKLFVGFSDITTIHTQLNKMGLVSVHGKMVASLADLDVHASTQFWSILESKEPYGVLPANTESIQTLVPGVAEGELTGGCLCLLAHACGSPYAPDFTDKLVLIEDVGEAIYRADRDLTQLLQSANLDKAAGFIIGDITDWVKQEQENTINSAQSLWRSFFIELDKPTITGFLFGHIPNPLSIPLGICAKLDAAAKSLILTESAAS